MFVVSDRFARLDELRSELFAANKAVQDNPPHLNYINPEQKEKWLALRAEELLAMNRLVQFLMDNFKDDGEIAPSTVRSLMRNEGILMPLSPLMGEFIETYQDYFQKK